MSLQRYGKILTYANLCAKNSNMLQKKGCLSFGATFFFFAIFVLLPHGVALEFR